MAQHQYVRNISDEDITFPTLSPILVLEPGAVAGIPTGLGLPFGTEPAKAADHQGPGKAPVHDHPAAPGPVEPDRWHGEEITPPEPKNAPDDDQPDAA